MRRASSSLQLQTIGCAWAIILAAGAAFPTTLRAGAAWDRQTSGRRSAWEGRASAPVRLAAVGRSGSADANDGPANGGRWPTKTRPSKPSWPASGKPSWPGSSGKPSPLVIPQSRRDPGRWPGPRTYQNPSPRTVAPLPAPSRPKTATLQPNSQTPQTATAVKKNAPPKKTGFALDDEAEYGDYGGGPAFGQPDDSTPTDNDLDIPDDPEMDETSAENSDESKEQEPAKSDDATPGSADPPSSTSPTIPDPSGGAGAADPPPSSTPDSSKPAKTGSSSDDGKELGTTASPDDGQELGTTAPADDKKPAGNNGGGQWPSPNGGQGSGKPGGGKWASPTNPPPANNNDQYLPLDPAKDYKGPNRGNSGPSWNPWDPKRPGKKAGDVDVYLPAEFPDETYIDPDTGQKKTMSSAGVGIGVNLGGNSRPSSNSRPPEPTPGDVKYFDALDQAQNAAKPKAQDPDRNEQGGPTNDAATGGAPDRGAPGASTTNQMDQDRPPNGGSSNSQNGSMRVRVKPADALTDALTPDFVTKGMESAAQGAVDALERGVRWFYGSGSKPEQQAQEPQKSTPAPTSDEPAKPDRLSDEERARNRAATEAARKAAEPDWNAEQGAKFGKQYGPRPADPEQAKKWDRAKKDAIDSWIFEKQMQLESPVSEGGIRM